MLAAEAAPIVKIGGLGDVLGALPAALCERGHDVCVAVPHYDIPQLTELEFHSLTSFQIPWAGDYKLVSISEWDERGIRIYFIGGEPVTRHTSIYGPGIEVDGPHFVFYSLAALAAVKEIGFHPDIIHIHDSHPGAAIYWLVLNRKIYSFWRKSASVLTIHNLPFQNNNAGAALAAAGLALSDSGDLPEWARDSLMGLGIKYADAINAVSPGYAKEILTEEFGAGLDGVLRQREHRLCGIVNGLDYESWNYETDRAIHTQFGISDPKGRIENKTAIQKESDLPESNAPLLGVVSRLDHQKGFDLLAPAFEQLASEANVQLVVLGTGEPEIETTLHELESRFPAQVSVSLRFDSGLARRIYAGCDLFVMPSRYEPCGIGQMIALRYGAIPVVRAVGGLNDTIIDYDADRLKSTGFKFADYSVDALVEALRRAIGIWSDGRRWNPLVQRGMQARFSWSIAAQEYERLYERALSPAD